MLSFVQIVLNLKGFSALTELMAIIYPGAIHTVFMQSFE